jgi:hypothetical protein
VINNDGILYLRVAALFDQGDWNGGLALYGWPFYSLLIAALHRWSALSFEHSAHLLSALFFAVTVFSFVTLVKDLGGARRELLIAAAALILLHPASNDYRSFVIRDAGYWAFYLVGIVLFLRFQRESGAKRALGWGAAMWVATLFRIEGSVILSLLPFVLLVKPNASLKRRLALVLQAHAVLIALVAAALAGYLFAGRLLQWGRMLDLILFLQQFGEQLSTGLQQKATALDQAILNEYSSQYALAGVIALLFVILGAKAIAVLNVVYAALAAHGLSRFAPGPEVRATLACLVLLNLAIVIVFLVPMFYLQGRFVIPLALILMLPAPFSVTSLYEGWRARRGGEAGAKQWLFPAVCGALLLVGADSLLSFGPSKDYLKQAGVWLKQNTRSEAKLYSDSEIVTYYADKPATNWKREFSREEALKLIDCEGERGYDYLALTVSRKQPEHASLVTTKLKRAPVARFRNKRGDEVLIFVVQ